MPRHRPPWIQLLHQPLERQLLMLVRLQVSHPHSLHQLPTSWIPARVRPQHQRVYKKSDQPLQPSLRPPSYRTSHHHVRPAPQPRQQSRQSRLQHHEQTRMPLPPYLHQPLMHFPPYLKLHPPSPITPYLRPLPVPRQLHLLSQPRQLLLPVPQLPTDLTPLLLFLPQHLPLPHRVIGILHLHLSPSCLPPLHPRLIRLSHLPRQYPQRPPIPRYVVQHQHHYMLPLPYLPQLHPQRNLPAQVEPSPRCLPDLLLHLLCLHLPHLHPKPALLHPQDLLSRLPPFLHKDRSQTLVPLHHVSQPRLQRLPLQLPFHPQRQRYVVDPALALQPIQKPQPPLRIRQRYFLRPLHPPHPTSSRFRPHQLLRQLFHRRRLENQSDRHLRSQPLPQPAHQLRGQQRLPAQFDKVVVQPHSLHLQHLRHQPAHHLLLRRPWRPPLLPLVFRFRQRPPVYLPVRRQRHLLQRHDHARHHVPRQLLSQPLPQLSSLHSSLSRLFRFSYPFLSSSSSSDPLPHH